MHAKNDHLDWGCFKTPKKSIIIMELNACPKWSSSLRWLRNQKKVSPSLSKMHAKNDHLDWGCFKTQKKSIIIMERNACQKWSSSFRGLQNQKKKYHQHWTNSMTKMIIFIDGAQKNLKNWSQPKKKYQHDWTDFMSFHVKNDHYHRRCSKTPQNTLKIVIFHGHSRPPTSSSR